ncbi:MAG: hypothetical protein WBD40_11115 [Tepidisphaeraceae bacterium]
MGKSVDLPDPLESASTQPLGNADDLLAQMAGEEVDRLLAESDAAEARAQGADAPSKLGETWRADAPAQPEAAIQDQLDALFSEITAEQPNPAATEAPTEAPTPTASMPAAPIAKEEPADPDAVMSALRDDPEPKAIVAPEPAKSAPVAPISGSEPAAASAIVAAPSTERETTRADRAGLADPDPADALPGPGELKALAAPVEDDRPLPVYLKPLEWMNAPLNFLPQGARDVLGQIAILTLVNAIAVLIYVFVFRKS